MSSNSELMRAEGKGRASQEALIDRLLRLLSSVRFGIVMITLMVVSCFLGMGIIQSNVEGFDTYYASLTNSEKLVYAALGLFNVYSTWWFQSLLALTSLTIILASIDHFPAAWRYVVQPKKVALAPYIRKQMVHDVVELDGDSQDAIGERLLAFLRSKGLKGEVTRKGDALHVFAQRGVLNRLGPYFIHVSLLTIF